MQPQTKRPATCKQRICSGYCIPFKSAKPSLRRGFAGWHVPVAQVALVGFGRGFPPSPAPSRGERGKEEGAPFPFPAVPSHQCPPSLLLFAP
jgi:hypothetical protein